MCSVLQDYDVDNLGGLLAVVVANAYHTEVCCYWLLLL